MNARRTANPRRAAASRRPGLPQVRIVGTPEQVAAIAAVLQEVLDVADQSPQRQRRSEPGQVAAYLTVTPKEI